MDKSHPPQDEERQSAESVIESDQQINSRYAIWSKTEIVQNQNVLVNLSSEKTGDVFLSSIIDIDPQNNTLMMDPAQNQAVNNRFVRDQKVVFETILDQVRVYFTAERVWHCVQKGEAGLCMRVPESIIRLQRRDFYRVRLPSASPVLCAIPIQGESGTSDWQAAIVDDISLGGIALLLNEGEIEATHGMVFKGCRLSLPDIGEIEADLETRNITQMSQKKGGRKIRIGCQFTTLSNAVQTKLQRYIIKLECERRALTG
jgi:c-di-GMP-binding flagellar brake protein YcgR